MPGDPEVAPETPDPAELDHLGLKTPPKLSNSGQRCGKRPPSPRLAPNEPNLASAEDDDVHRRVAVSKQLRPIPACASAV